MALRVGLVALGIGVLTFAVQGGEYGSTDLWRQQQKLVRLQAEVDSLQGVVDSLVAYQQLVETDAATQERIAREEFGMVKPGEVLYRFADGQ
jgi:cell division protein FtsB